MQLGKMYRYIGYRFCLCVCTVEDFSTGDEASGVRFCTVVYRRPGQGISHYGNFAPPEAPGESASAWGTPGHAIGMCV